MYDPDTNAFIDVTCGKCGRFFGWFGTMLNRPPCPKCGHVLPQEDREKNERAMEDLRAATRKRQAMLVELCAGEFKAAYERGKADRIARPPKELWPKSPLMMPKGFEPPYEDKKRGPRRDKDPLTELDAWRHGYWEAGHWLDDSAPNAGGTGESK